jgi:hypothetical protein
MLAGALLAGCASPPPATMTPPPASAVPSGAADTCGARPLASLIGQDVGRVPPARDGQTIRVACTTCAITEDFSAQRLNVFFDEATGKIVRLTCG